MTLFRLRYMEYLDVKAKTREDINEWIIDSHTPEIDPGKLLQLQVQQAFADETFLDNFAKEKQEFFSNMSAMFSKGCESEFDYFQ